MPTAPRLIRAGALEVWHTGSAAPAAFAKHSHDEMVISANLSGGESLWLDGRSFEAGPGDVTLYMPGQIQASQAIGQQPWEFVTLYAPLSWLENALHAPVRGAVPVTPQPKTLPYFTRLARAASPSDVTEAALMLLGALAPVLDIGAPAQAYRAPHLDRVKARLRAFEEPPPSLDALAALAGLSATGLVRAFRRETGLPPMAWALDQRLIEARQRLRGAEPIAALALDLGFSDQAHFTRAFRRAAGITPGAYRKALIG